MPARSAVRRLPEATRKALDRRLIEGGFAGYAALAEWLHDEGWEISRAAIHRYGQELEGKIEMLRAATQQAEALVEASGDEGGAMSDATLRLITERVFTVLLQSGAELDLARVKALSVACRGVADAARAGLKVRADRRLLKEAREAACTAARAQGLSADAVDAIGAAVAGAG